MLDGAVGQAQHGLLREASQNPQRRQVFQNAGRLLQAKVEPAGGYRIAIRQLRLRQRVPRSLRTQWTARRPGIAISPHHRVALACALGAQLHGKSGAAFQRHRLRVIVSPDIRASLSGHSIRPGR